MPAPPKMTFMTHGEPQASAALKSLIESKMGWRGVSLPAYRQKSDLNA